MTAIGVIGLAVALSGFAWLLLARPRETASPGRPPSPPPPESEPRLSGDGADPKALRQLKWARENAMLARHRGEDACRQALEELRAAFAGIQRQFGVGCGLRDS